MGKSLSGNREHYNNRQNDCKLKGEIMIKKQVTYVDFNGKTKTEELRFHMNKLEYLKFLGIIGGDLEAKIAELTKEENFSGMIELLENLLVKSYGILEGEKFIKNDQLREDFSNSEQLAEIFADIITNPVEAKSFFEQVGPGVPKSPKAKTKVASKKK